MGVRGPPSAASALACTEKQARPATGGAALREVHANLWDPQGFLAEPRREPTRPPARLPLSVQSLLQGPAGSGLRGSPVVLEKSALSLHPVAFQNSFLFPVRCTHPSESRPTSACMLSAKVRTGERWSERRRASRLKKGQQARPGQARQEPGKQVHSAGGRCRPRRP